MTAGALSVTSGAPFKEDFLPLLPEVHFVPYPYSYCYVFDGVLASVSPADDALADERCDLACSRYLEHVIEDPHSGVGKPAAVIVEPIQGEGGSIVPGPRFMQRLREICDEHGVVPIADEIQAGCCRTGAMFSFEYSGIVPDIVTMSKALGGVGLPISGIAYWEELDTWPAGKHIGTFRGNVTAYVAGNAAIEFMVEQNLAGVVMPPTTARL